MSNILIIKHGSLGDIVQISGVLKDIREHHLSDKIYLMTTQKFSNLFNQDSGHKPILGILNHTFDHSEL